MSCRFYGKNGMFGELVEQHGNECGLVVTDYEACAFERDHPGDRADEARCPLVEQARRVAHLIHIAGFEPLKAARV